MYTEEKPRPPPKPGVVYPQPLGLIGPKAAPIPKVGDAEERTKAKKHCFTEQVRKNDHGLKGYTVHADDKGQTGWCWGSSQQFHSKEWYSYIKTFILLVEDNNKKGPLRVWEGRRPPCHSCSLTARQRPSCPSPEKRPCRQAEEP